MNVYKTLYPHLEEMGQHLWSLQLQQSLPQRLSLDSHGRMASWLEGLQRLPDILPSVIELKDQVAIGTGEDLGKGKGDDLIAQLQTFHPWRKGPYTLFGLEIETEWRSDWKWDRVLPHIQPLKGRRILDVGCGNGYHGWRMRGAGADFVLGIDPFPLSVLQFLVMQHFIDDPRHHVIPIGIEELPADLGCFDTVFSMGVLYHRRSPLDHLLELKSSLRQGGELVLETLIVEGGVETIFMPPGRYAKMRNVWFIPSVEAVILWLQRCGFAEVACVDINRTSLMEQRSTEWMRFESLADFLDPQDRNKTIEGHPAPLRAIFTAIKN